MSETTKLMNFEEFRAAEDVPFGEARRQHAEFFRNAAAADEVLDAGGITMAQWTNWDNNAPVPSFG